MTGCGSPRCRRWPPARSSRRDDPAFEIGRGLGAAAGRPRLCPGAVRHRRRAPAPRRGLAVPGVFDTILASAPTGVMSPGQAPAVPSSSPWRRVDLPADAPRTARIRHPEQLRCTTPPRHRPGGGPTERKHHGDRQRRREHPRGGGRRGPTRPPPARVPRLGRPVAPPGPGPRRRRIPGGGAGPARLRRLGRAGRRRGVLDPVRRG